MNPYLEQASVWHDFHHRLIVRIADELTPNISPKYFATIDENVYIHELSAEERFLPGRPDVTVVDAGGVGSVETAVGLRAAPVYGEVPPTTDILREPYIEIRDRENREVVTVIEVLSPSNKAIGSDRDQYIAKRRRILTGPTHLVEIDLLSGWTRMPIEKLPQCDYVVMVRRTQEHPRAGLWPIRLKERLPEIPIPLQKGDAEALVNLQRLLHIVYDAAGYENYIYGGTPSPPLHPEDAKWAEEIIATQVRAT
jgi:hypothetical protein